MIRTDPVNPLLAKFCRALLSRAMAAAVVPAFVYIGMGAGAVLAQSARPEAARQLEGRREALEATQLRTQAVQSDLAQIAQERERLNARLIETGQLIQRSEAQMTSFEQRLGELAAQETIVRGSLNQRHDQISRLMAAMQRMGRNPPPVIITQREDALQMVRSAMLLAKAFPELRQQAEELTGRLDELVRVMSDTRSEGEKLRAETARLNDARTRLSSLMEAKKQSLAERQHELAELKKAAAELNRDTASLSDVLAKLDKTVAEKTGLGAYEAEVRAMEPAVAAAAAQPGDASATGKADAETRVAVAIPPRPVIELAPRAGAAAANPGRIKPLRPFIQAKAQLPMPAHGRRVLQFGEKTHFGGQSKGIVIETRHSAQITAPCDGWIVYAGPFRSYGQLLIINPGSGYHILLAGMSQIDVQVGQFVLTAEPVGTMAPAPKRATQDEAPVLYVEFRKEGRPIDPDPWWAENLQKVQG